MAAAWWSPVAPCTPQACVTGDGPVVGRARRLLRYAAAVVVLLIGVVLSVPLGTLCGPAGRERLIRRWTRSVVAAFGVGVRLPEPAPREPGRGLLVVSNHVSWLDIVLIAAVLPGRNVAKREIRDWPLIGRLCVRGRTIFIDRERIRSLPDTVAEVAEALRSGATVVAFPEGSTWCGREEGRYRRALFQAALDAGADVQPLLIRYRHADGRPSTAAAFLGEDTLMDSVRRVVAARGLTAEVTMLPRIAAGSLPDRRALASAARYAVAPAAARASVPSQAGSHPRETDVRIGAPVPRPGGPVAGLPG
ncbi:lysophospholipid acyltransferase family protein [Streptomyces sp. NPDC026673]|uniref:lysophospholipid acyltransferase family protein n=1 Tax=Streptomyces sp. NPDC026673 TaxID=3155724 RepID=UPI0033FC152A